MNKVYRTGAIGALLDEYEKAIAELSKTIEQIPDDQLAIIIDPNTSDPFCKSYQGILAHVVSAGYNYAITVRKHKGEKLDFTDKVLLDNVKAYQKELDSVFQYTVDTFQHIKDNELEEYDNEKKMLTRWGQRYDMDQLFEHAIVHILRHRRQIEKFIQATKK